MNNGVIIGFIFLILIIVVLSIGIFVLYREVIDLRAQINTAPSIPLEIEADDIVNLDLNLHHGTLNIEKGESFSIQNTNNQPIRTSVQGNTFVLDTGRRMMNRNNNIILTFPRDIVFENVKISIGGGILEINHLTADTMHLSVGGGKINARDVTAQKLSLESGAGEINLTGNVSETLDINQGVGQTSVVLDGKENDFNYKINYAVGRVRIGEREYSGISGSDNINNNADKNMTINSSVGNLNVQFHND
ncbi:MAG: DUF4097 domain-containing protein [Fastidiosipila sp.]|nr:DUF4097 domain-containing protein [Fastidiosipila sp.]